MTDLIRYLLASSACLSIAYLVFLLFISNRTGFHKQRLFLMVSLAISLIVPITGLTINLPRLTSYPGATTGGLVIPEASAGSVSVVTEPFKSMLTNPDTYIIIYALVSALLLLIFIANLIKIIRLYFLSEKKEFCGKRILVNSETESPFSFFDWIFIPKAYLADEETGNIVVHEEVHAAQYHSADNIIFELTAALMWFNPLVWMMLRSVHLIHEYLADEGALGRGIDRIGYQSLLLNQAAEGRLISLYSSFNNSLKNRIIMITSNKDKMQKKGRMLVLLPLSLILVSTTGFINGMFHGESSVLTVPEYISAVPVDNPAFVPEIQKDTTVKKTVKIRIASPAGSDVKKVDEIRVMRYGNQNTKDTVHNQEIRVVGYGNQKSADSLVFILDGTRIKNINTISPDAIMSVSVLKGESATALYGSDASDGAIIITTKKNFGSESDKGESEEYSSEVPENVLFIINGVSSDKSKFEQIETGDIISIEVFKKESVKKVTDGNYEGVIVVKTK